METNKASRISWKHIVCCVLILVVFVLTIGIHTNADNHNSEEFASATSEVIPLRLNRQLLSKYTIEIIENEVEAGPKEEVTVEISYIDYYITKYQKEIKFFADTFSVSYEDVIEDLHMIHEKNNKFDETNVGLLTDGDQYRTFDTVEYGLVEYFYNYVEKNPKKVNRKRIPYSSDAKYIENLIIYYTTHIYSNVDTSVELSIGAAESGYYKVKYMLAYNNIYGGMNSKGLIKYRNIEYGILSYIRLLSKNYYGKNLDTIAKIGKVYCPTYDKNGNKVASPHWLRLVNTAMKKYKNYDLNIKISDLLEEDEIA